MKTKIHDIVKGRHRISGLAFLARVSSLESITPLGADSVEAITIFDSRLRIIHINLLDITYNFGEWDRYEFIEKYPEHLI